VESLSKNDMTESHATADRSLRQACPLMDMLSFMIAMSMLVTASVIMSKAPTI
jgi:hypothetical protein